MRLAVIALLIIAALSGCAESGDESVDAVDEHDHSTHDHDEGNETLDGVETANNTAPVAVLTADVLNGTAPLMVNLTLDGSDADGDNLTWILVGNETLEGSELPTTLNFTLDEGNHTFVFTVSDGELEHSVNLTIEVVAGEPAVDPNAPVDMGWYIHDPVTNLCHVKDYSTYGPFYVSSLGGGTWVLAESNGEDGLQISNNHPAPSAGFDPSTPGCVDGDIIVV